MKKHIPTLEEVQEYFKDAIEGISVNFGTPFKGFNNIHLEDDTYYCQDENRSHRTLWRNGKYATITKTKELQTAALKSFSSIENDLLTLIEHLQLTLVVSGLKRSKITDDAIAKLKGL
jgi:hypothetical protein